MIICDSEMSVDQWRDELERWTTVNRFRIFRLSGKIKDKIPENMIKNDAPIIFITTFHMLSGKKKEDRKVENPTLEIMKCKYLR